MTATFDAERLARAREMTSRLTDTQLAQELKGDPGGLEPEAVQALHEEAQRRSRPRVPLVVSTTPAVGRPIRRVLGVVGAESVVRLEPIKDQPTTARHIVGRRTNPVQDAFRQAREELVRELNARGAAVHADAVVGVAFNLTECNGPGKSMLVMLATGTAVELESPSMSA